MNFEQTVDTLISLPRHHSVLIVGMHGIGKSDAVREAAKILGVPCVDQRLSQCDVGDLKGMPFQLNGRTVFAPPDWFPLREEDAKDIQDKLSLTNTIKYSPEGILFLDEIDRAVREVQQAGFELVLDHRLNMRYLPDGWRTVSAINQDGDIYHVNEMDVAFINRFFVILFKPSEEEWYNFALKDNRIHSSIIEFLRTNTKMMDPTKEIIENNPGQQLYTRRSWEKFSECLLEHEHLFETKKVKYSLFDDRDVTSQSMKMLGFFAQGYLGTICGEAYKTFIMTSYQSLNGDIILNKMDVPTQEKIKKLVTNNRAIELGSYGQLVLDYVQAHNIHKLTPKQATNLLTYIRLIPNEYCADFFQKFKRDCSDVAIDWYTSKEVRERVVAALANPRTGAGAAA